MAFTFLFNWIFYGSIFFSDNPLEKCDKIIVAYPSSFKKGHLKNEATGIINQNSSFFKKIFLKLK